MTTVRRRLSATVLAVVCLAVSAQAATVSYDYVDIPLATVQTWQPVLYVNNTRIPITTPVSCTAGGSPSVVTCTFDLPDITGALTPSGPQTFELATLDAVLGEGPRSSPLSLVRPGAPISLRFTSAP